MLLDLIALAILGLFVLMGALRGGVASGMSLLTLVLSYAAAVWAAQSLGEPVSQNLGVSPLYGPAIAGTGAFLGTAISVGLLGRLIRKSAAGLRGNSRLGIANRWLGGFFGFIRGGLVVLLVSWLVIWLDAARETGAFDGLDAVPDIRISSAAKITEKVVESAVSAAMGGDNAAADVVARLASKPGSAVKSLQGILDDRRIEALQRDRFFWTLIENGAYSRAMNRRTFQDIARSDDMRRKFADVGVVPTEAAEDPAVFQEHFGVVLSQVGPKLKGIVNDPEILRLAEDPEIIAMLENGDTLGLVRHEGVQRLVAKVSASGS
jgi:membrane protein required for colicin V production